jgi:tRNA(His) guanylyltransferase
MNDSLGDRMKDHYESRTQVRLPRRTYTILRLDGRCFHTFTRQCEKPFDYRLMTMLDAAAIELCKEMMGCRLAYGQSDEYSFLLTDFDKEQTEAWFDGNAQKIVSVATSIFTLAFANAPDRFDWNSATFDCRVFTIPDRTEVENYFIWRQKDASRNSLNMLAEEYYSHKALHGKSDSDRHEMLHAKGVNWNDWPTRAKRGRVIRQVPNRRIVTFTHKRTGVEESKEIQEQAWSVDAEIPIFTQHRDYLGALIPRLEVPDA